MNNKFSLGSLIANNKRTYLSICACLLAVYALLIAGITKQSKIDTGDNSLKNDFNNIADGSDLFKISPTPIAPKATITPENSQKANSSSTEVTQKVQPENKDKAKTDEKSENTKKTVAFDAEKGIAKPVDGKILLNYSVDHTIYHKTLAQYMTNPGVLYDVPVGTSVLACCDGIVSKVYEDTRLGKCVEVTAGDYIFTYGQLKSSDVSEGELVKEGNLIGMVSEPTKYYSKEGTHLYFSVKNSEGTVDPAKLIRSEEKN